MEIQDNLEAITESPTKSPRRLSTSSGRKKGVPGFVGQYKKLCSQRPTTKISVTSCFIAQLHLANEKALNLIQRGEDFLILRDGDE
jgi:chromatin segregation and condensation protein Rec8/ScpA/Scc1 (kleisin family)